MDRFAGLDPESAPARQMVALADALSIDAPAGRVDALTAGLHDDVVVWQAFGGGRTLGKRELVAGIRVLRKALRDYRYTDIERLFHPGGYSQTHVLRGTTRAGVEIAAGAALWVEMEDGLVVRVREYLDSAAVAPIARAAAAPTEPATRA